MKPPCTIDGCDRPNNAQGLCHLHYGRKLKAGELTKVDTSLAARFWRKVDRRGPAECWPWLGATGTNGYGQLRSGGANKPAHRISWELHNGQAMDAGLYACHACDNPICVNPTHIFPGTPADNIHDMVNKGRHRLWWREAGACSKGHPHTPENTRVYESEGYICRKCRVCARQYDRAARRRAKAAS